MHRVFRQIATPALFAALALGLAACGGTTSGKGQAADVAATVNGKEIKLADVDRIVNQQLQGQQLSTPDMAAARLQALDNLIQREAVVQKAEKEKAVPTDDEVTAAINEQRSRVTAEDWQKFLEQSKLTEEQLREEARKDLAVKKLQDKLYGQITIRDQEINDFFNSNRQRFVNPRGVGLSDIVTDSADSGGVFPNDAKSEAEAKAKIDSLYAQLKTGADFATVARANSEDQSLMRGGDIGFANEDTLRQNGFPPELVGRLFNSMKVGDITEPIHFPDGRWIIFKLTNRQLESKPLTLDDVKGQIQQGLTETRQTILQGALIRTAMSEAKVVNHLADDMLKDPNSLGGNAVAPGASPAASPAATASPAASASPASSPAAGASPAATPKAAATPAASPKR
ncbi:MAG: SurA N-terminal domain-containing protein [Acidobacteria bacterium]|nr:SurA N-terminal domain-containing protein [Acidobacteriota bacterium]